LVGYLSARSPSHRHVVRAAEHADLVALRGHGGELGRALVERAAAVRAKLDGIRPVEKLVGHGLYFELVTDPLRSAAIRESSANVRYDPKKSTPESASGTEPPATVER
jgi:hypothetical protein